MEKTTNNAKTNSSHTNHFPPVVAVLGHVDHGKTSLLDAIRKTSIAQKETGGITQKIGTSSVEIEHEGSKRRITFIDTPGHEAFAKMRGRGASASDIALLIISSVDGVKPQTKESISLLLGTKMPFIVVLTKSDLETKNPEKVKKELLKEQVMLEGYGGDVPIIEVSAKTNRNIKELLDLILLLFDLQYKSDDQKISSKAPVSAIVIESKLDIRAGAKATVIIKNGTLHARDELRVDKQQFKVRILLNDQGKPIPSATIGEGVEILGFEKVPAVGSIITDKQTHTPATSAFSSDRQPLQREMVYKKDEKVIELSVILVTDTQGSLEAITNALPEGIHIIEKKTGEVHEADISLAKSTGSIVLSFSTRIKPEITQLAFAEKVLVRNYTIIYELLDEVKDALEGKILSQMEQIYGKAKILATFPFEKAFAYGISVTEGRIARGDRVRIMRSDETIGESSISSLRIAKNPVSKVEKGNEAGIILTGTLDIQVGDMIVSHS